MINQLGNPIEIAQKLAERVRERRLEQNLTQSALAKRADMSLSSYRRFETTGEISLKSLVQIAVVLDATDEFANLFARKVYTSIDEVVATSKSKTRKRGSKNE